MVVRVWYISVVFDVLVRFDLVYDWLAHCHTLLYDAMDILYEFPFVPCCYFYCCFAALYQTVTCGWNGCGGHIN